MTRGGGQKQGGSKSWKDLLLQSSLPLEHIAGEALAKRSFLIFGEFGYPRLPPESQHHSVDVLGRRSLSGAFEESKAMLDILIECKYAHDSVSWVFTRAPGPVPLVGGCGMVPVDHLTEWRLDRAPLKVFEDEGRFSRGGVALHVADSNRTAIEHGRSQLAHAAPHAMRLRYMEQMTSRPPRPIAPAVLASVLVTTAPLWLIRAHQPLAAYRSATNLEDIADRVSRLVYSNLVTESWFHAAWIWEQFKEGHPDADARAKRIYELAGESVPTPAPLCTWLAFSMETQIVCTLDALEETLDMIVQAAGESVYGARQVARFVEGADGSLDPRPVDGE